MKYRKLLSISLGILIVLAFSSVSIIWSSAIAAEKPKHGGILKIITTGGVINLGSPGERFGFDDPIYQDAALEKILKYDFEGTGKVIPWLATSWEYNPEYTTLTFKLRKGVKFHDGTDFNAAAVKFNLELLMKEKFVELKTVSSIDVLDDYTIRLNITEYDSSLLRNLADYRCPIVSPNSFDKEKSKFNPIGTGPFKFVRYDRDALLKFEKFDGYWQEGKPYLDGIEFIFIADPVTRLSALKAGDGHVLKQIIPSDAAALKASGKYDLYSLATAAIGLIGDSAYPESPFNKIKVRQAVAYAIDNEAIAKACGFGYYPPLNQAISTTNEGYNPDIKGYPFNPKKAKELLVESGYPNGFATKIAFRSIGGYEADFCTMVQGYLANAGIKIELTPVDPGKFTQLRFKGFKDTMMMHVMPIGVEKDMSIFWSDRASSVGTSFRHGVYYPDDYTEKLLKVNSEPDDKKRIKMLQEVGKMAIDDYCLYIPVLEEHWISVQNKQVRDLNIYKYYGMVWHAAEAWLEK